MKIKNRMNRPLLYQEVVTELYRIIDQNQIQPGDRFPSERELTENLGISRNVLREAFHVLETRGIIVSRQGSGRYLRQLPKGGTVQEKYENLSKNLERFSLLEAYEVRQVLEVKAVELIIRNAGQADIEELEEGFRRLKKKFEETKATAGEFELHRLYAQKSGSQFLEQTLELVLSAILDMMSTTFHDIMITHETEKELESHRKIIQALKEKDVDKAKCSMFQHIQDTIEMLK